jgi:hypothetical protein
MHKKTEQNDLFGFEGMYMMLRMAEVMLFAV